MTAISKHFRWTLAVRGIAAIAFGFLAWVWPGITLLALLVLFGAFALVDGAFALIGSLVHRKVLHDWWMILLIAVVSMAVGVMTFARPGMTALILLFLIAARALVVGVLEIVAAIEYRHHIQHEWLLVLAGILSVLFGLTVMAYPMTGALAAIWLIGAYSVVLGALQLAFAFSAAPVAEIGPGEHPTLA